MHVEQSPVDHLLRPERDIGGGLFVVGVELDPAGAISRRQGNGAEPVVAAMTTSGRIDPEPARAIRAASPIGICL